MRVRATIVTWFEDRRYGFAKPEAAGTQDIFIGANHFIGGSPYVGARIECDIVENEEKRNSRGSNIRVLSSSPEAAHPVARPPVTPVVEAPVDRSAKLRSRSKHERLRDDLEE